MTAGARSPLGDVLGGDGSTGEEDGRTQNTGSPEAASPAPGSGRKKKGRKERRTTIQVASLNINGFGNLIRDHDGNKWGRLYRMMSEHRIGILLLQETHLTRERTAAIHEMYARKIRIYHSANPDAPTQRDGVAIVLNLRYVETANVSVTEIVPGKALQLALPCRGGDTKVFLCIYAPTSQGATERKLFFQDVRRYYEDHPDCPRPDLMGGDFNTVEDALDRLPAHDNPDPSVHALDDLKATLGLMIADGWRVTNPTARNYTFHRGTGCHAVFSRLDRLYVTQAVFDWAREWNVHEPGIKTDHSLVSVQLTPKNAPVVGPGRPVFPLLLLRDRKLTKDIKDRGLKAMHSLDELAASGGRSAEATPQQILYKFKDDVMQLARDREREVVPKLLAEIHEIEHALKRVKADENLPEPVRLSETEALTKQVRQLRQWRYRQQQQTSRAAHRIFGDRPTKYWSKLHRECAPRDIIMSFEKEGQLGTAGEKLYELDSVKMAAMARRHHMDVQRDDPEARPPEVREEDIKTALSGVDAAISQPQATTLGAEITYGDVLLSLRYAKTGSAPGIDGIPFELWKTLHARHVEDVRFPSRAHFDVVKLITAALEDIRVYGVDPRTPFAQGWIAPIYKEKGERTRVVNYRPITLLNTDYKLLTKTLAVRLAEVAPGLIHRAQAGFVPGRKIHNHTQLARMMMSWAEVNEVNGAIVALDQEKAYDKIAHDYLWRVLERLNIPVSFIRTIQSLYANARTSVMINGILSKSYRIYRGVRQGDPLSCLLFDLAIEPLSAMIRKSDIEGFAIPKCDEVLKAVLFADDTTVYLSHRDDFATLQTVLDTWCSAAKARFNISKTEVIPIGEKTYRDEMAETYRVTGAWKNYPRGVRVARHGEAVRILGAFFGNGVDQLNVWTLVLNKIVAMRKPLMHALARWKRGHATLQGKRHVVQMIIGGMTQFMTMVQRMPAEIVTRLTKLIRDYLWDDRHSPPVAMEHVCLPVEHGGLGILDLDARSDAIDIMWLKTYLDFSEDRPIWAFLADDLYARHVPKDCRPRIASLRLNPFLQRWKPRAHGLPPMLSAMMSVARKYGVRLEGLAFSRELLRSMPLWDHAHADRIALGRLTVPSRLLSCLQDAHRARTVGDFMTLAQHIDGPEHRPRANCACSGCTLVRTTTGCESPHACCTRARDMIGTLPGKWNPYTPQPEDVEDRLMEELRLEGLPERLVPFDRRVTTRGNVGNAFRVFTGPEPTSQDVLDIGIDEDGATMTIATDGSCYHNGEQDARAGAGLFVADGHALNRSFRVPVSLDQSNQTGELMATLLATMAAGHRTRVTQVTDSRTTMDSLTRWKAKHEDLGYIFQRNTLLTRTAVARLRMRRAHTLFEWVKGHTGHPGNEAADRLAAAGADKPADDTVCLTLPPAYSLSGAKLQAMTQKAAYHAIRARKDRLPQPRPRTVANLDRITSGLLAAYGTRLHDETIWRSFRARHVSRPISQFLWMATHDAYMIGSHWFRPNMPADLRARALCARCGECESMTHLLFECDARGQEIIWRLLEQLWTHTGARWAGVSWGTTFGAACAVFATPEGGRRTAIEHLWCILCTEALHLVWKLRCERVIRNDGGDFTEDEVTNRFYATLESRLSLDRRTAALCATGRKALRPQEVERIWLPVIDRGSDLPPRWVVNCGVLVGIKRGR